MPFFERKFSLNLNRNSQKQLPSRGGSRPPPAPLNYSNALLSNKGGLLLKETALLQKQFGSIFHYKYTIRLHSHGKDKTKFNELCLFQRHSHIFWVRHFLLKFHTPIDITVKCRWFFFNFVEFLWLYMSVYLLYSCRVYLMLSEDTNRALG